MKKDEIAEDMLYQIQRSLFDLAAHSISQCKGETLFLL